MYVAGSLLCFSLYRSLMYMHQSFDPARTLAIASEVVAIISRRANGRKLISDNSDQLLQKVLAAVSSLVEKIEVVRP